jgi:hypothetical protein
MLFLALCRTLYGCAGVADPAEARVDATSRNCKASYPTHWADQSTFFPAALAFLHLARATAERRAFWAALILRFGLCSVRLGPPLPLPLAFAQRARWAAAILARPAGLMPRLVVGAGEPIRAASRA